MTTRTRSAKSGKYVTRKQAKRRPATTVSEKVEKVLWRGWVAEQQDGFMGEPSPFLFQRRTQAREFGTPIRVKIVEA